MVKPMDLREIKELLERDGGKIIIVENEKPTLVVMAFDDYRKRTATPLAQQREAPAMFERPPVSVSSLARPDQVRQALEGREQYERGELTIDDLPV